MAKKPATLKPKHKHSLANAPSEPRTEPVDDGNRDLGAQGQLAISEVKHVRDLRPFRHQARRHTQRNLEMIGDSIQEVGFARSIVIDEDGEILAGAGTTEAAGERGLRNVRVIDADGSEIIAIRRKGLTDEQKLKLALYDNRAGDFAEYDLNAMRDALKQPGIDPKKFFTDSELLQLEDRELAHEMSRAGTKAEKETVPSIPEGYTSFSLVLSNDAHTEIRSTLEDVKERTGLKTIAEALLVICRAYINTRKEGAE